MAGSGKVFEFEFELGTPVAVCQRTVLKPIDANATFIYIYIIYYKILKILIYVYPNK